MEEAERQRIAAEEQTRQARQREAEALERLKRMRRERRWIRAAIISFVALVGRRRVFSLGTTGVGADLLARSRRVLQRAHERLAVKDDDRRAVLAHASSRAIVADRSGEPRSCEAAVRAFGLSKLVSASLASRCNMPGRACLVAGFSPDNRQIVAIAEDGNLARWDAQTFEPIAEHRARFRPARGRKPQRPELGGR